MLGFFYRRDESRHQDRYVSYFLQSTNLLLRENVKENKKYEKKIENKQEIVKIFEGNKQA